MDANSLERNKRVLNDQPLSAEELRKQHSLFYPLFERVEDTERMLLLLDLVEQLGDHRELPVVESLLDHPNKRIRKKTRRILPVLEFEVS